MPRATVRKHNCAPFWCLAPGASARGASAARFAAARCAMGLDTVPSIPRALRGRDATEECRWIMSLELDGGKHVGHDRRNCIKLVSRWASSGLLLGVHSRVLGAHRRVFASLRTRQWWISSQDERGFAGTRAAGSVAKRRRRRAGTPWLLVARGRGRSGNGGAGGEV